MRTAPLRFPSLAIGYERSPGHAAHAALATRYDAEKWFENLKSIREEAEESLKAAQPVRENLENLVRYSEVFVWIKNFGARVLKCEILSFVFVKDSRDMGPIKYSNLNDIKLSWIYVTHFNTFVNLLKCVNFTGEVYLSYEYRVND